MMSLSDDKQADVIDAFNTSSRYLDDILNINNVYFDNMVRTATSFFLPHQNLAKSHHLSSGAKDSKPLKYINTDIREQNIYNYD